VKAKIVNDIREYKWSSLKEYLNKESGIVNTQMVRAYFSDKNDFLNFNCQTNDDKCTADA